MPTDFSQLDLSTILACKGVIVTALQNQCCQWEQESTDAAANGFLNNALTLEHWAFAADLLSTTISIELSGLFSRALNDCSGDLPPTSHHSVADQMLNAFSIEVAAAQEEPALQPIC